MSSLQSTPVQRQLRRKLVRGVFSAPAVMTVCSGSAFAAASNPMRCVANHVNGTNPKKSAIAPSGSMVSSTAPDSVLRVQLKKKTISPGVYKYYVTESSLSAFKRGTATVFVGTGYFREVDIAAGSGAGGPIGADLSDPFSTSDSGKWVVVQFDATGNIKSVGANLTGSTTTSMVGGSCWTSVVVG